jgi:hypothetical protein
MSIALLNSFMCLIVLVSIIQMKNMLGLLFDAVMQDPCSRSWKLCRDDLIHLAGGGFFASHDEEVVGMRQAPLLKLYGADV